MRIGVDLMHDGMFPSNRKKIYVNIERTENYKRTMARKGSINMK
jgi:hypothetical protein